MMAYKGYLARITFDEQANLFHGEVINIRDVVTFQGQSVDELRQAFADSVEDYLSFCAERGEAPDQPFSGRLTVQLSPEQHRKVILAAEKAGKDVAQWVAEALEQAVGRSVHDEVRAEPL
jgi:predicted HicB family RNase H-like nuclease